MLSFTTRTRAILHKQPYSLKFEVVFVLQSSLLGLLLASRFFRDPLICLPCGISVIVMTLVSMQLHHFAPVLL